MEWYGNSTMLFESWQMKESFPNYIADALKRENARPYSTRPEDCSAYNKAATGRKATLYPHVLKALERLIQGEKGADSIAAGVQVGNNDEYQYYCMEYSKGPDQKELLVYNPVNGRFHAGLLNLPELTFAVDTVKEDGNDGQEYIALMAYASMVKGGPIYDEEFYNAYSLLKSEYNKPVSDAAKLLHAAYLCCSNLWWRIENGFDLNAGAIPFDRKGALFLEVGYLPYSQVCSGLYSPTVVTIGTFTVFEVQKVGRTYEIKDLQEIYSGDWKLSEREKCLVPDLPDCYKVSASAKRILEAIKSTPARVFMLTGSAGVGKTTDAQLIAQVRGVPYYKFTCGPNTDEIELTASMVPNTVKNADMELTIPDYEDLLMDPPTALMQVSGEYREGVTAGEAFEKIVSLLYRKGYQAAKAEKDFSLVESPIIEGCKGPSVVEIQEPLLIERSATLAKFNALLDESASIELINGDVIHRHPDTVIILTTNLDYIGCRQMNESVLSRIRYIDHRRDLSEKEMALRAMAKTGMTDYELLKEMAEVTVRIREHLKEEELRGGVCEYREYEDWIWAYRVSGNLLEAAEHTIVAKASMDAEEREEIMEVYIRPFFEGLSQMEAPAA
ncbi:MAG: hypothetical protein LUI87_07555 [Lachnospiraceae bacterium]|nr:hypothetical protein [Lachnospiraceae bacterium]